MMVLGAGAITSQVSQRVTAQCGDDVLDGIRRCFSLCMIDGPPNQCTHKAYERLRWRRCAIRDDITELTAARKVARRQRQLYRSLYEAGGGCLGQPFLAPLDGFPYSSNTDQQGDSWGPTTSFCVVDFSDWRAASRVACYSRNSSAFVCTLLR